ncbi:MAG: cation:dicarboxylase symporter family transporter [Lachnospiraceae bacterium]|nr:cation:dicarboxylase symporter family transporter [Lachnospiraceae bacterium]
MKRFEQDYELSNKSIDEISETITRVLSRKGLKRADLVLLRLSMEDILIALLGKAEKPITGTLVIFKSFGTPIVAFRYKGEPLNPVRELDEAYDELAESILSDAGFVPEWSYKNGANIIRLDGRPDNNATFIKLISSIFGGVLLGLLGSFIPANIKDIAGHYVFNSISSLFMNILNTFVGFLVFFSVIAGICSVGSTKEFNKIGLYSIRRMLLWTVFITTAGFFVIRPFFHLQAGDGGTTSHTEAVINLFLAVFPSNPITPFAEDNMLQILVIALFVGIGILLLGERVEGIKTIAIQANSLIMKIVNWICKALPFYIFSSLTVLLWENGIGVFRTIWKPFLLFLGLGLVMLTLKLFLVYTKLHISPLKMLSKIKGPMLIGLATASTAATLGEVLDINEKRLGVSERLNKFATPMSTLFYRYQHACFFMIILLYLAEINGAGVNLEWCFMLILLSAISAMILPPVSGGQIIVLGMMMAQLGISDSSMALVGVMSLFMDFFAVSLRTGCFQMEIVLQADKLGELDREVLMS